MAESQCLRVDCLLVQKGLCESRTKAQQYILKGRVYVNGKPVNKPSQEFPLETTFEIKEAISYASRSGFKLAGLLQTIAIDLKGKNALDIGISTGGFTDCLLQHGVKHVTGIDVGHEQLHPSLKNDVRVAFYDGINARALENVQLPYSFYEVIVIDVSFISLTKILNPVWPRLASGGYLLALIKPQFELSPGQISKGVVPQKLHNEVCQHIDEFCQTLPNASVHGIYPTCLKGQKGNQEFFIVVSRRG